MAAAVLLFIRQAGLLGITGLKGEVTRAGLDPGQERHTNPRHGPAKVTASAPGGLKATHSYNTPLFPPPSVKSQLLSSSLHSM